VAETGADVVVVGAGSAGCVLAARLSEDAGRRVLLLEAGGPDTSPLVRVPLLFSKLFRTRHDWAYATAPQEHLGERRLFWPRGKLLGGCSSINAMLYVRGHPADYDGWAATGNPGWSFADVLPVFRRSERYHAGASRFHGGDGPLCVSPLRCVNPLSAAFVEAGVAAGLPRNRDFNGPVPDGVGLYEVTQKNGRRHSTAAAFLRPTLRRPNLAVRTHAHVLRVLFEGSRAVGVEYLHGGTRHVARAEGVVLCGGAVNSPQLLLLSGVGPVDALRRHDIAVVADLPGVGENLQDHPVVGVGHDCRRPVSLIAARQWRHVLHFWLAGRGPLTSPAAEAGAFVRSDSALPTPDLQFHFVPSYFHDHGRVEPTSHGFGVGVTLVRPHSRGRVTLASADPLAPPVIDPCYLADPRDGTALVAGLRLARWLLAQAPFDRFRGPETIPGSRRETDADLLTHVRRTLETLYHPAGTCRMGTGPEAVVGPDLRVHGVERLWVADASVMPTVTSGNTNAPSILIGEKAADLIAGRSHPAD
jgi:choline dehydrogenase